MTLHIFRIFFRREGYTGREMLT